ncbi:hypothetical protein FGO68_gene14642 [Halteria grandinella]|uniref:Hyaluronan/mRNA-binding protein domain-containing protein n=1 Tax=Halteria grandinella TaxID=5974 RepID=A0A8J8NAH0_HALGN|nr:hypothetical protein FGO68_gene14642 [Halteria grandinella]
MSKPLNKMPLKMKFKKKKNQKFPLLHLKLHQLITIKLEVLQVILFTQNVDQVLKQQEAKPAPKQIDEEALKREKLFVMKTKVDEKRELEQKAPKKQVNQKQGYRSELNSQAQEYLGFTAERNEERREYKGDREYKGNQKDRRGGQGQQNKKPVQQQGVQLDDKDFPAL